MVAILSRQRLNLPVAPLAGAMIGIVAAVLFALIPAAVLEDLVIDSGIASVIAAAEPPLGLTARFALIFLVGGGIGAINWFALFLLIGGRSITIRPAGEDADKERAPVLRRADAHPDAPARRPLSATRDLGTPFLEVHAERPLHMGVEEDGAEVVEIEPQADRPAPELSAVPQQEQPVAPPLVEQALPADLDQPLAAYDPASILDDPADWFPAPAPLRMTPRRPLFEAGERFETFDLPAAPPRIPSPTPSPFVPSVPPMPRGDPSATIHALLDRLEQRVTRREAPVAAPPAPVAPPAPPPVRQAETIEEALDALRRLATRR